MLELVKIREGQTKKYKQDEYLSEGLYFYAGRKLKDQLKKIFPCIPSDFRKFSWLIQIKPWVIRLLKPEVIYEEQLEKEFSQIEIKESLLPWQKTFLQELNKTLEKGVKIKRGLIAGLGAGKTRVALSLCQLGKALYVCPKHIKSSIQAECVKWELKEPIFTTPEGCKKIDENYDVIIIDECLSVKNPNAVRAQEVRRLTEQAQIVLAMTGTPLSAPRLLDIRWINSLGNDLIPNEEKYMMWNFGINPHYEDIKKKYGAETDKTPLVVDSWNLEKMVNFVTPYLKSVDMEEVNKDLPEKRNEKILFPKPKFFNSVLSGLATEKEGHSKRLTQARCSTSGFIYSDEGRATWIEKKPIKIEWVKSFIEDNPDEPIVIFSGFVAEQEKLIQELKEYNPAIISEDENTLDWFLAGQTNLLICSANRTEGMNLQRSRIGIFLSNSTSPVKRVQAEGRLHRQGQKRNVIIYDLLCVNTLDERALELLQSHIDMSESFVLKELQKELERISK